MTAHQLRAWEWYRRTRVTMERPGLRCSDESWAAAASISALHGSVRADYANALADHYAGRAADPDHLTGALDFIALTHGYSRTEAVQLAAE